MSLGSIRTDVSGEDRDEGIPFQQRGDFVPVESIARHQGPDGQFTGAVVVSTKPDPYTTVDVILDATLAGLVGKVAKIGWKLGAAKPVLCYECRHYQEIFMTPVKTCGMVRVEFVHSGAGAFAPCREVNFDGKCTMFEPHPPNAVDKALLDAVDAVAKPKVWWKPWEWFG